MYLIYNLVRLTSWSVHVCVLIVFCFGRIWRYSEKACYSIFLLWSPYLYHKKQFSLEKVIIFLIVLTFNNFIIVLRNWKAWKHWLVYLSRYIPVLSETSTWDCLNFNELLARDKHNHWNRWLKWDLNRYKRTLP